MLDLYTHEIPCPDDRAMRKFLWYGTFHDGRILSAMPAGRDGDDLHLRVDHGVLQGIARPGTYLLRFHEVTHIECAGNPFSGSDWIYDTTFLNSPLLHAEQTACERPLYHLRITTWTGYIDVVFARFSIRLEGGRVDYRLPDISDGILAANRAHHIRQTHDEHAAQLRLDPAELDDYDVSEYHASALWLTNQAGDAVRTAAHTREVLALPLKKHNALAYAACLLGLHGAADDLPALTQLLLTLPPWECQSRRIVLDAMARIHERTKEAAHD